MGSIQKVGGEIHPSLGANSFPATGILANGNIVVVGSAGQGDTYVRTYLPDGTPLTDPFRANSDQGGSGNAEVLTFPNGNFLVTFQTNAGTLGDGDSNGIHAQLFDSAGNKVGAEFLVNTETSGSQANPEATLLTNGNFIITWYGSGFRGQLFDSNGIRLGSEMNLMSANGIDLIVPQANGGFAVVGRERNSADNLDYLMGHKYDASGQAVGGAYIVAKPEWRLIDTAELSNGDSMLVFDGVGGIYGLLLGPDGLAKGPYFRLSHYSAGAQLTPFVASTPGGFLVAWEDQSGHYDPSGGGIVAQLFDNAGNTVGDEFLVNTKTDARQQMPHLAGSANGLFSVTWADQPTTNARFAVASFQLFQATGVDSTDQNETIHGTDNPDTLHGGDGDDVILGGNGDDQLFGDAGADRLTGGNGADRLDGGDGLHDTVVYAGEGGAGGIIVNISESVTYVDPATGRQYGPGQALDTFGQIDTLVGIERVETGDTGAIVIGSSGENLIIGGARNDLLDGQGDNDRLDGGGGDDQLLGGLGLDELIGGAGNDVLVPGPDAAGPDFADGGSGRDTLVVDFTNAGHAMGGASSVSGDSYSGQIFDAGMFRVVTYTSIERFQITGTAFNDQIGGGTYDDILLGGGGVDAIFGGAGADTLDGQDGNDEVHGGLGADIVRGGNGNDMLYGEEDDDVVDGGAGNDTLEGGDGNDTLIPGSEATGGDHANGGAGTDLLVVDFSNVSSRITGKSAPDPTRGGYTGFLTDFTQTDTNHQRIVDYTSIERFSITGTAFDDSIGGGNGDDLLYGLGGNDTLIGGAGNDLLAPGKQLTGVDQVQGGLGNDLLVLDFSDASTALTGSYSIDPNGGYQGQISDRGGQHVVNYSSIEHYSITGTAFNDSIGGLDGDDELFGLGGSDLLVGGAGNDRLVPGSEATGTDEVRGGAGRDLLELDFSALTTSITGFTSASPEGGLSGQIGGLGGQRTITYTSIEHFSIVGTNFGDSIGGGGDDDTLDGGGGNDQLFGGGGNDTLLGGAGNDALTGGAGRDTMTGGAGADRFIFAAAAESAVGSADRIVDFTQGQDRIDLSGIDANSATAGDDAFTLSTTGTFHNIAGELRWYDSGQGTFFVEGDVNGDGQADFQIEVTMPAGLYPMTASDFVL